MALTQARAEQRASVIRTNSVSYNFHISLQKGDSYSGYAELTFELDHLPAELVVDFKGKQVTRLLLNGEVVEPKIIDGFIFLDLAKLKVGNNLVAVHYANRYDNDGTGCYSFIDVDTRQYIYTELEPYAANKVFPCFDQPDLKAKMKLSVICPSDWKKVLSNEYPTVEKDLCLQEYRQSAGFHLSEELQLYLKDKTGKMTIFPESKLLPTYLYCFIAGEYLELKLAEDKLYKNIPMSLYSIESLYKYMVELAPFIFEITIESMKFYEDFFQYPFAFNKKYDQIFVHEYRMGAMENAAVVTYNDLYLFKEKVPVDRMLALATTISHELSHHWFGNLVTMKWWDDLWLNESFATFISYFCLEKLKTKFKTVKYESAMASFFQRKGRGYNEDQMITTHPVRGQVVNTSVAESIFDGITYSKGAATMKQLFYLMGEENFSKALASYFPKYEWKNATIDQFLAEMQNFFTIKEFSLNEWKQMWLQKASLNVLQAQWNPKDLSNDAKMFIHQSPFTSEHPTLRLHKIKVGFFLQNSQVDVVEVLVLPQKETVVTYDGSKNYKAVLLNLDDLSFVKTNIDSVSLDFFGKNIDSIKDILSRSLIWDCFFQMVKDAKMTSHNYVQVVINSIAKESSDSIFQKQFDDVYSAINSYTPEKYREELNTSIFKFIYDLIGKIPEDKQNRITILKNKLINFSTSQINKLILLRWKNNEDDILKGIEMSTGQKWRIVAKAFTLNSMPLEQKEAIFEAQKAEDSSDTAKNYRLMCDSLKANEEEFEKIYEALKAKDSNLSVTVKGYIASGWNNPYHKEKLMKYRERFYKDLQELVEVLVGDHYQAFYNDLSPIDDDLEYHIAQFEKISYPPGKDKYARAILKKVDQLKRRLKAYQLYSNPSL